VPDRAARALAVVAAAAALYAALVSLHGVVSLAHPLPFWDQWDFLHTLGQHFGEGLTMRDLWAQHNEHRIFVPRLLFLLDAVAFGARSEFLIAATLAAQLAHAGLLILLFRRVADHAPALRVIAAATVVTGMLLPSQLLNFIWGFQVQFPLVYLAVTASFYCLVRRQEATGRRRWPWLAGAVLAGWVATGTMANGVLVWPLLVLLAACMRSGGGAIAVLAAAGAAAIAAYVVGYGTPGEQPGIARALADPAAVLVRSLGFLGSPLWPLGVPWGVGGGAAAFALAALALWRGWRQRPAPPAALALRHVLLFVLGAALLCGIGRSHLAIEEVVTPRYATAALLLWVVVALLFLAPSSRPVRLWRPATAVAAGVGMAAMGPACVSGHALFRDHQLDAASSLLAGVRDDDALSRTHGVDPESVLARCEVIRRRRLSVFADGLHFLVGTRLHEAFAVAADTMEVGLVEAVVPAPGGGGAVRISGWAFDPRFGTPGAMVLVVDGSDRIVGLGHGGVLRPDVREADPGVRADDVGWRAWSRSPGHPGAPLAFFTVLPDGRAARLPDGRSPADPFGPEEPLDEPAPLLEVEVRGAWRHDGMHPGSPRPPFTGDVLGSWCGSDANTGEVRVALAAPAQGGTLVIPVLSGPDTGGTALYVVDALLDTPVAALSPAAPFWDRWRAWHVRVPARPKGGAWIVTAVDRGTAWGQWLAVGSPRWRAAATAGGR
jgi:hypothetical protein